MTDSKKEYQRLPGKGRPPFPRSFVAGGLTRLYLASDHLLKVETSYWTQRYRRFYLKDIQVIQITRNANNLIWSWALGFILAGLAAVVYFTGGQLRFNFGFVTAVVLVLFLLQLLRGASCKTQIRTASSTEPIFSLQQLRKAQKVLATLAPLIREAQGGSEDPASLLAALAASPAPPLVPVFTQVRPPLPEIPLAAWHRLVAWGLGGTLVALAISAVLLLLLPSSWGAPLALGFTLIAVMLDILVMVRPVPGCGRGLAGAVLGFFILFAAALYGLIIRLVIANPALAMEKDKLRSAMFALGEKPDFVVNAVLYGVAAGAGIFGVIVLLRLLMARKP